MSVSSRIIHPLRDEYLQVAALPPAVSYQENTAKENLRSPVVIYGTPLSVAVVDQLFPRRMKTSYCQPVPCQVY